MLVGTVITTDLAKVESADEVGEMLVKRLPGFVVEHFRPGPQPSPARIDVLPFESLSDRQSEALKELAASSGLVGLLDDIGSRALEEHLRDPRSAGVTTENVAYVRYCDSHTVLSLRIVGTGVSVRSTDAIKRSCWDFSNCAP